MHFVETDACLPQAGNSHVTYNHLCLCIVIHAHFILFPGTDNVNSLISLKGVKVQK
jgi:hypothetical protein